MYNTNTPTLEVVKGSVQAGYDLDATDPLRVNMGSDVSTGELAKTLTVSVQSNVNYQLIVWCELLFGSDSPTQTITFKSKNNGGST